MERTLPCADEVGERAERLVDVGRRVLGAVDLVEVDPVGLSRRRLSSTSRMIQRRELPNSFGSSPIVPWTFVASTTLSRRPPASALPTISSDSPRE